MPLLSAVLLTLSLSTAGASRAPTTVNAGAPALAFALPAVNEEVAMDTVRHPRVALSDFTGVGAPVPRTAVVLYFFSGRPTADLESLARIQKRFDGKGVQVVAVTADAGDRGDLADYVADMKLSFPVLRDRYGVVSNRYGITRPPLTFVIDAKGAVFAVGQPSVAEFEDEITKELAPLIAR